MQLPQQPRRNLVILRAGDSSLHPAWVADPQRNFDLLVSYYGKTEGMHADSCDIYERRPGPKWPCIGELLAEHPELIDRYEAVWLPDDDLAADTATLNQMFELFHAYRLQLAQPALTRNSYFTFATLLQKPDTVLRFVGFVEVMAPLFSQAALRKCVETFTMSRIGWGLDFVWPSIIGNASRREIGILDATPVHHTRPVRGGDLYKNNADASPFEDEARVLARYGQQATRFRAKYEYHAQVRVCPPSLLDRLNLFLRYLNAQRRWRRKQRRDARGAGGTAH